MKFENLASSSSGNCYWIELDRPAGEPARIMLECGLGYQEILMRLQRQRLDISKLDAVVVTHNHKDHSQAAADLARRGFRVYGNSTVCSSPLTQCEAGVKKAIAPGTFVIPFLVEHDAPEPFGYIITTDKECLLFVTDCKFWKADLSGIAFDYVIIEANYDGETMHFAIDNAKENNDLKMQAAYKRILKAHMSIKNSIESLKKLNLSQCKAIFLIHLSDRHSRGLEFKYKTFEAVKIQTFICKKDGGII